MNTLFYISIVILILLFISAMVFIQGKIEYSAFVEKLAKEKTFEEIDKIISEDETLINSNSFKGHMLDMILDHQELWEQIKECKLKTETNDY